MLSDLDVHHALGPKEKAQGVVGTLGHLIGLLPGMLDKPNFLALRPRGVHQP